MKQNKDCQSEHSAKVSWNRSSVRIVWINCKLTQPASTCSKLTIKKPERRQLLWTYLTRCSIVSIVKFEHVNVDWEAICNEE